MKIEAYPYIIKHQGPPFVLFWLEGSGNRRDSFVVDSNELLLIRTSDELKLHPLTNRLNIRWGDATSLDLNRFISAVRSLRSGKSTSTTRCRLILDGWNLLEDLAYALEIKTANSAQLKHVYDKIFGGANLRAMTPRGKSYSPIWTSSDVDTLTLFVEKLFTQIIDLAPNLKKAAGSL